MHILLVNPPCRIPALIPLGLGYIASVLRDRGHSVTLWDFNVEGEPQLRELERKLERVRCDIIGIGGLSTTYNFVKHFSKLAKSIKPEIKIIAGNMVSTSHPELLLNNSAVDICVIDEGEDTMLELVEKIGNFPELESIHGIAFKKHGIGIITPQRPRIKNLDKLPFPAWDLFSMEIYINNPIHSEYGLRSINVSTVRGCPFQCIYCSRPFGSGVYMRSPQNVISEIKELKNRYKIQYIAFSDDMFISNKNWVRNLCSEIIREHLNIEWGASARVNMVDPDLLRLMRKSGCRVLSYGFESGSQKILDIMKKGVTIGEQKRAIDWTRKAGITIEGSFMIGMIGETEETVKETIEFIKETGLALHRFFYTTPYPGTPLYDMAKEMGRIPQDEDKYVSSFGEMCTTLLVNLTDMEDEELIELKQKAECEIRKNFSLKTRLHIMHEDLRRVKAEFGRHVEREGIHKASICYIKKLINRLRIQYNSTNTR